jgi:alkylation response protein AidB-like acyl-CoA dehydrogenase
VLDEAGKVASDVLAPLNAVGDREGLPAGKRRRAHAHGLQGRVRGAEGGRLDRAGLRPGIWRAGPALPDGHTAVGEMFVSANMAFNMYQGLTHGAYSAIHAHGTDEQKATYLPKMVSCDWTGTMNLTEPHCGTDLGLMRTKAEPQADGSYRITGQKIFISAGEHDMAENIIHLVLAKAPGGGEGTKGISLFIVPKFLVNADGSLGARNASPAARSRRRWASTATPPA